MSSMSVKRANPASAGMAGFGLTTVLLSLINAGLLPAAGESVVLPLALAFGGLIQLIAGLLEYKADNTFGTTVFLSYGAFWVWFGLLVILADGHVLSLEGADSTIGAALLLWAVVTLFFWTAAFRHTRHIWVTLLGAAITLVLLGVGHLSESLSALNRLGGWTGIIDGLLALYGSYAILLNETFGRVVLPLGESPILAGDAPVGANVGLERQPG